MGLQSQELVEMLRRMLRIRFFEETVIKLSKRGEILGGIHICIGQEATAVGACMAVEVDDSMTGNHRSHGHPIAKGAELGPLMAELMGRATGVCRGKGGSLHLADFKVGSFGESGIVGGAMPVATGVAFGAKARGTDRACICFFGDAASNTGAFHESINLASVWKLPVVYLCENNLYGVTTRTADVLPVENVADRASAYGIPSEIVDGQDPVAVYQAVAKAVSRARAGAGPSLVEAKTYRFRDHAEVLLTNYPYRSEEELDAWKQKDPIPSFRRHLIEQGVLNEASAKGIDEEVAKEVEAAVEFAQSSPLAPPEAAFEDLYADSPAEIDRAQRHQTLERSDEGVRQISYLQALSEAQRDEMLRDESVFIMGEDVRSNLWGATGFASEFPPERVLNTPLSEAGFVGAAVGAAMNGMRPIVDMSISSFVYVAMDQFVNQAAKYRYMFGGQAKIPVVYRATIMYGASLGAHHSDRPYPMFMAVPGLKIIAPASAYDAKGLLRAAIRDDNPVLCFEDVTLWFSQGAVPEEDYVIPLGIADIKRAGSDVTIVAIAGAVRHALDAAEELAGSGISAEVVDPRSLVPLDIDTILASVAKTGRLVVVDPAHQTCSAASEIAALVAERGFDTLRAPIVRVTTPDIQIPFGGEMERPLYPSAEKVLAAARKTLGISE